MSEENATSSTKPVSQTLERKHQPDLERGLSPVDELIQTSSLVMSLFNVLETGKLPDGSPITTEQRDAFTDLAIAGSDHAARISAKLY